MKNRNLIKKWMLTSLFISTGITHAAEESGFEDEVFEGLAKTDMDAVKQEYMTVKSIVDKKEEDVRLACFGEIMIDWSDTLLKTFRSAQNLNFSNVPGNIEFSKLKADLENDRNSFNEFVPGLSSIISGDIQTQRIAGKWPKSAADSQMALGDPKIPVLRENLNNCSKEDFFVRVRAASKTDYDVLASKSGNVQTLGKSLTVVRLAESSVGPSVGKLGDFRTELGDRIGGDFKIIKTEKMTYEDFVQRVRARN